MARGGSRRPPLAAAGAPPRHAYRDAAIFHGGLAVLIVIVAWLVGSELPQAAVVAVAYFAAATAWSWWRFRQRARRTATTEQKP
jgi:membrane protein implicated in regulation of membrane protease activity